jgi:hypothetical protein
MGASKNRYRVVFEWSRTVGSLLAEPAEVRAICSECGSRPLDLRRVLAACGPSFSFWNRNPPCPYQGCGGRVQFSASRIGANVWPCQMWGGYPVDAEALLRAWFEGPKPGE